VTLVRPWRPSCLLGPVSPAGWLMLWGPLSGEPAADRAGRRAGVDGGLILSETTSDDDGDNGRAVEGLWRLSVRDVRIVHDGGVDADGVKGI
jgi:hypothetical protein